VTIEPTAVTRALRIFKQDSSAVAQRVEASLDFLLGAVRQSCWPDIAWRFSMLTADGFPLEFAFSSADEEVRFTSEVAGPELPNDLRLDRAESALATLGAGRLPADISSLLRDVQRGAKLRYGAWIGARYSATGERYKLYVEVPDNSELTDKLVCRLFGAEPLIPGRTTALRMIGYDVASSSLEFYFGCKHLEPWELGLLLRRAGVGDGEAELLDLVEQATGRSVRSCLPGPDVGFSLSTARGLDKKVFSLFFHAGAVFGGDGSIREHALRLARGRQWKLGVYERLSEPLSKEQHWVTHHTMATFALNTDRRPIFHLGLRPPEPGHSAHL
jgi:hypothetical protein